MRPEEAGRGPGHLSNGFSGLLFLQVREGVLLGLGPHAAMGNQIPAIWGNRPWPATQFSLPASRDTPDHRSVALRLHLAHGLDNPRGSSAY